MLKKQDKKELVKKLVEDLAGARSIIFNDFQGVVAKDIQDLRAELRKEKVKHKVVKISLLKKVLERLGIDTANYQYQVPLAVSFSTDDEVAPARILQKFAKINDKLKILGGYLGKDFMDESKVKALASLPSKLELQTQLVRMLGGPARGLVSVLAGNIRGLVNVLDAKSKM